jgi:soluble lytic murein transglycosylase-like protein
MDYPEGGFSVIVRNKTVLLTLAAASVGVGFIVANHIRTPFDHLFDEAGKKYAIDPNLLRAIARKESGMSPSAVSPLNKNGTRDIGLMQINETTADSLKVPRTKLPDPAVSIDTAARLLVSLRKELGAKLTLHTLVASYNAGAPAIKARGIFNPLYVADVLQHHQLYTLGRMFA